jgi:hypothetical protein
MKTSLLYLYIVTALNLLSFPTFAVPVNDSLLATGVTTNASSLVATQYGNSLHRQGWTSSPNSRGTIDIIWSCAFTMFLCSWSILCLNVSSPDDNIFYIFHRRFWLTCLCFLGPEFTVLNAAGQWVSAKRSLKKFHDAGYNSWTMQHAFFADMGGFVLETPGTPAFPVDGKQLLFLIKAGFVDEAVTRLDIKVIRDKNKVDGMLRIITVCQVLYFVANIAGRAILHLAITCMELTTAAFIICTIATVFFWLHKPADVNTPEHLRSTSHIAEIMRAAAAEFAAPERKPENGSSDPMVQTQPLHLRTPLDFIGRNQHFYLRTPLDFVSRKEWHWSLYWSNWINILRHLRINFAPRAFPADRFENTISLEPTRGVYWCCLLVTTIYTSVFVSAWNYEFPTKIEQYLWRAASITILGTLVAFWTITEFAFSAYPAFKKRYGNVLARCFGHKTPTGNASRSWYGRNIHRAAAAIRNNSVSKDPALDVPLKAILPIYVVGVFYCTARTYILLSDLVELRSLPASAFVTVDWSSLIPHI